MRSGDPQQTKDSREDLEGNLEKIQRSLRYLDKQVQELEKWYVLATTPEDETQMSKVKIGAGKFGELAYEECWKTERAYSDFLCKNGNLTDPKLTRYVKWCHRQRQAEE